MILAEVSFRVRSGVSQVTRSLRKSSEDLYRRTPQELSSAGRCPKGSLLPGACGLHGPNVNHCGGPSVMAGLLDRTRWSTHLHDWRV